MGPSQRNPSASWQACNACPVLVWRPALPSGLMQSLARVYLGPRGVEERLRFLEEMKWLVVVTKHTQPPKDRGASQTDLSRWCRTRCWEVPSVTGWSGHRDPQVTVTGIPEPDFLPSLFSVLLSPALRPAPAVTQTGTPDESVSLCIKVYTG